MAVEVDAGGFEEFDGRLGVHVFFEVEVQIEDPGAGEVEEGVVEWGFGVGGVAEEGGVGVDGGQLAVGGPQGDADLDGFEDVDVAAQGLVVVLGFAAGEVADGTGYYAGELGVHADVGVGCYQLAQHGHFRVEVVLPDFADAADGAAFDGEARGFGLVRMFLHGGAAGETLLRGDGSQALALGVAVVEGGGDGAGAEGAAAVRGGGVEGGDAAIEGVIVVVVAVITRGEGGVRGVEGGGGLRLGLVVGAGGDGVLRVEVLERVGHVRGV